MAIMPGMGFPGFPGSPGSPGFPGTPPFVPPQGPLGGPMGGPQVGGMPQGQGPLAGPQGAPQSAPPGGQGPAWLQNIHGKMQGAAADPMFQAGMGLLGAGQDRRINAPQAAMQGLLTANQVQGQQADQEMRQQQFDMARQQFEQQHAEQQRREEAGKQIRGLLESAEDMQVPESVRQSIGILADVNPEAALQMLARVEGRLPGNERTPMNVAEYEYYKNLPNDADRREYLNVKRAMQFQQVEQAPTRIDPVTGQPVPLSGGSLPEATGREIGAASQMQLATSEAGRGRMQTPDGGFVAVPGTDAARTEDAERRSREAYADVTMKAAQTVFEDTDRALDLADRFTATGITGAMSGWLPTTPANRLSGHIASIKSNVGIDSLLRIKQSGAGLGQVPQSQLDMLASLMGRLDHTMPPEELKYNLSRIQELYADIARQMAEETGNETDPMAVYQQRLERIGGGQRGRGGTGARPAAPEAGATQDGYRFKGGDPADPNSWEPL